MQIYPIRAKDSQTITAFEIDNIYIDIKSVARILERVANISSVSIRKKFSHDSDVHIKFLYRGKPYMVWEPFGDNSRYWLGPEQVENAESIEEVQHAFEAYEPSQIRRLIGYVLTGGFLVKKSKV